ncbi:MAG: hypothetical protein NTY61_03250, partial [Candidatus Parcubacteria bacterium]|nr:hypothetical protein [Candidatus Parcubacteria bacterium]
SAGARFYQARPASPEERLRQLPEDRFLEIIEGLPVSHAKSIFVDSKDFNDEGIAGQVAELFGGLRDDQIINKYDIMTLRARLNGMLKEVRGEH